MRIQYGKESRARLTLLFLLILTAEIIIFSQIKQKEINVSELPIAQARGEYSEYNKLPRGLSTGNISYLYGLKRGVISESTVITSYQGKIDKIYNEPTSFFYSKYFKGLKLISQKGEGYIFFTSKSFDSARFLNQSGQPIGFDDLREGQSVLVTETINMLEKELDVSRAYTIYIL